MEQNSGVSLDLIWPDVEKLPVYAANQFTVVGVPSNSHPSFPEAFVLTIGHVTPPLIPAKSSEEYTTMLSALQAVPVQSLGRYNFNVDRLRELADVLNRTIAQYENAVGKGEAQ